MQDASKLVKSYHYTNKIPVMQAGEIVLEDKVLANAPVNLVISTFNRHGLIAGSTGSGKTKTMQVLCEQLSLAGCPSLVMDVKGDVSGLAYPGDVTPALKARAREMDLAFKPRAFPVELFSLDPETAGIPLRATVEAFGDLLLSRMLNLNDTQASVLAVLFLYAKKHAIDLIDLDNLKELLRYVQTSRGKIELEGEYGSIAGASVGAIMRKIVALESQGGNNFFGAPAFDVQDLAMTDEQGRGKVSIVRLMNMQSSPQVFSTFMLKLLADAYKAFPETGDLPKPRLVLFIDEAHLIFDAANKALLDMIETTVKLIRSRGVGLIFCTQTPNDIPESVLSQLGLKIQHSLRAFTAKDRKALKLVAENFPVSGFYNTERLLTDLGIGEALLSGLDAKGQPTPLVHCKMRAPESRMGSISDVEANRILQASQLYSKYRERDEHKEAITRHFEIPVTAKKGKASRGATSSTIDWLGKNTLIRQLVRDLFRWALALIKAKKP